MTLAHHNCDVPNVGDALLLTEPWTCRYCERTWQPEGDGSWLTTDPEPMIVCIAFSYPDGRRGIFGQGLRHMDEYAVAEAWNGGFVEGERPCNALGTGPEGSVDCELTENHDGPHVHYVSHGDELTGGDILAIWPSSAPADDTHNPESCDHEQCGHAMEVGYLKGRSSATALLRRAMRELEADTEDDPF